MRRHRACRPIPPIPEDPTERSPATALHRRSPVPCLFAGREGTAFSGAAARRRERLVPFRVRRGDDPRVGPRPARVPGARRRGRDCASHSRCPPCPRCVNCSGGFPWRCSPPALLGAAPATGAERLAIYRRTVRTNCHNALGATIPVVQRLVGTPFFHAAVAAFVRAQPSRAGDRNAYGDTFGDFLAGYPPAAGLPHLADVGRLEWAIDEANRAPDSVAAPDIVLAAPAVVPAEHLPTTRLWARRPAASWHRSSRSCASGR